MLSGLGKALVLLGFILVVVTAGVYVEFSPKGGTAQESNVAQTPEEALANGQGVIILAGKVLLAPFVCERQGETLFVNGHLVGPEHWIAPDSGYPVGSPMATVKSAYKAYYDNCLLGSAEDLEQRREELIAAIQQVPGSIVTYEPTAEHIIEVLLPDNPSFSCGLLTPERLVYLQQQPSGPMPVETPEYRDEVLSGAERRIARVQTEGTLGVFNVGDGGVANGTIYRSEEALQEYRRIVKILDAHDDVEHRMKRLRHLGLGVQAAEDISLRFEVVE